ncbi:MAG: serine peptidase [Terrestrivirus sp.]|uniref:Serine peptidase n=1 Tax=Terrestrivirus sp. TaxID=2487775 RepID=A0A3G4ZKK3_9VIRU|nr:MAG: serine peptidase [Terrestrivirus sp.]
MKKQVRSIGDEIYTKTNSATVVIYRKGVAGTAVGSGFCVDVTDSGDILVLTAAHVILQQAGMNVGAIYNNDIYGMFANARTKNGIQDTQEFLTLLGCDVSADVALMCTTSHNYCYNQPCLKFNSKPFYTGDDCYNISTPFNLLENNITGGIIRNTYVIPYSINNVPVPHSVNTNKKDTNRAICLMTDTAVAPGTSGGPFVDDNAEIIGMAQWRFSGTDSFAGGIQSVFLKPITDKLIELNKETIKNPSINAPRIDFNGTTGKGSLGIGSYIDVVGDLLIQLADSNVEFKNSKYNSPYGLYIAQVIPGSSLDQAGIVPGDVIIKLDDKKLPIGEEQISTLLDVYFKRKATVKIEWIHFVDQLTMTIEKKVVPIGKFLADLEYVFPDDDYELIDASFTVGTSETYIIYSWILASDNTTTDKTNTLQSSEFALSDNGASTGTFNYSITMNIPEALGETTKYDFYLYDVTAKTYTFLLTASTSGYGPAFTGNLTNVNTSHTYKVSFVKNSFSQYVYAYMTAYMS